MGAVLVVQAVLVAQEVVLVIAILLVPMAAEEVAQPLVQDVLAVARIVLVAARDAQDVDKIVAQIVGLALVVVAIAPIAATEHVMGVSLAQALVLVTVIKVAESIVQEPATLVVVMLVMVVVLAEDAMVVVVTVLDVLSPAPLLVVEAAVDAEEVVQDVLVVVKEFVGPNVQTVARVLVRDVPPYAEVHAMV